MADDTDREAEGTEIESPAVAGGASPEPGAAVPPTEPNQEASAEPQTSAEAVETTGEAPKAEESSGEPSGEPEGPRSDWRDRRIAKLTAKLRAAEEAAKRPEGAAPPEDLARQIDAAAEQKLQIRQFNDACNAANARGIQEYGQEKFRQRLDNLRTLVDPSDPADAERYGRFLSAGLETGSLEKLIYELGEDLDEADRIMNLSPVKMAVELARRSVAKAPAEISQVPRPIRTVKTARGDPGEINPADPTKADQMDTATWMRARERQLAKAR